MFPINRCPTLCVVLLVLHFLGDADAATAKASCLLQASETRLQTNHSDATMLDPQSWPVVELVNFFGNKSDPRFQAGHPGLKNPGTNLMIQWAFAIGIVLAGSRTLFQEAQVASSQDQGGKKRDALWDVTRSALMVLIINFHLLYYQGYNGIMDWDKAWYPGFYMPAFFMISGMFSKRRGDGYWSNILVNNVINACLFGAIYAPVFSPKVQCLWFLWALAVYRALLQPALAACHGHLGQWMGAGAGLLVAVVLNYAVTAIPLWWFAVLHLDQTSNAENWLSCNIFCSWICNGCSHREANLAAQDYIGIVTFAHKLPGLGVLWYLFPIKGFEDEAVPGGHTRGLHALLLSSRLDAYSSTADLGLPQFHCAACATR